MLLGVMEVAVSGGWRVEMVNECLYMIACQCVCMYLVLVYRILTKQLQAAPSIPKSLLMTSWYIQGDTPLN